MKKLLLSAVAAISGLTIVFIVRRAMLDMSESNKLWTAVTDDVGNNI